MIAEWDAAARDVRAALAACAVEIVDQHTDHLTRPDSGAIAAQVWGDITDLMYPPVTKETTRS